MPTLTRWFIRTALVYFVVALLASVVVLARPVLNLPSEFAALLPVYLHLLMVGWVTQLIIGVAYWMFPKFSREEPHRSERLGWMTYALLNVGLLLRAVGEPLLATSGENRLGWVLVAAAVLQLVAGWTFVINTWSRVRTR